MRSASSGQLARRVVVDDLDPPGRPRTRRRSAQLDRIGRRGMDLARAREGQEVVGQVLEADRLVDHAIGLGAARSALGVRPGPGAGRCP
jgi:hypothetical protein